MQGGYGLTIKAMSVELNPEDPLWQIWKEDRWRALRLLPTWFPGSRPSSWFHIVIHNPSSGARLPGFKFRLRPSSCATLSSFPSMSSSVKWV